MGSWAAREAGVQAIQSMGNGCLYCGISGVNPSTYFISTMSLLLFLVSLLTSNMCFVCKFHRF